MVAHGSGDANCLFLTLRTFCELLNPVAWKVLSQQIIPGDDHNYILFTETYLWKWDSNLFTDSDKII